MKKTFEELKSEFVEKCKAASACQTEFKKLLASTDEASLLEVVYNNLDWCIGAQVLSHEWFSFFSPEIILLSGCANTGKENTGFGNSGNSNSGYRNSGNWNSGDSNSGYWNSGDSNSGYRNSGAFCNDPNPKAILFNKESSLTVKEWESHPACNLMYSIKQTIWVPMSIMTDEEKTQHPKYETTDGYLKTIPMKEAWKNFWGKLTDENKKHFTTLPNFDAAIFEDITGIKIK